MMKLLPLFIVTVISLSANVYYSKVEPYEVRRIASNVSGVVLMSNESMLGQTLSSSPYLQIDAKLDKDELRYIKEKIEYLKKTVKLNENIISNLDISLEKKRLNYERVKNLKIKSNLEKDKEFYDLVNSENSFLSTQKEINTLKTQLADLELRQKQLIRSINDKSLSAKGFKLYSLEVKVGEVVNKGTPLATLMDTKHAILTIYLNEKDVVNAKNSVIYINGEKTAYKVDRVLNIADSKNISKYKAQIIIKAPAVFSKLAKVELK
ncbi:MAG: HlyD family efflux transporter periplasmic adaptor subunit [Sulfurimonas sp.]|nr:HlyD family efflux transporter periplasmic adaptor subunit [Sulfurimonas sp.]MDQ7067931.1 HlyD family efflux transporter periplasmic adaptor subunit [Sulfurimonas sp.]